jgi:hypothetical protein
MVHSSFVSFSDDLPVTTSISLIAPLFLNLNDTGKFGWIFTEIS